MIQRNINGGKINISKRLAALMLAGTCTFSLVGLTGCSKHYGDTPVTVVQSIETNNYRLLAEQQYKIIKTRNAFGEESFNFVKKISLAEINEYFDPIFSGKEYKYADYDKYNKYAKSSVYPAYTYLYFDAITGELISIQYNDVDKHLFKENEKNVTYAISTITSEGTAYDYAVTVYGDKETYTIDEIKAIIVILNTKEESNNKKR